MTISKVSLVFVSIVALLSIAFAVSTYAASVTSTQCPKGYICTPIASSTSVTASANNSSNTVDTANLVHQMSFKSVACVNYMSIPTAYTLANKLQLTAAQKAILLNPANIFVHSSMGSNTARINTTNMYVYYANSGQGGQTGNVADLCLDPGFVSNFPADGITIGGYSTTNILASSTTVPQLPSQYYTKPIVPPVSTTTSYTSYTAAVNYDKFTSEAKQYGYTSVFNSTGTKTVSISVIKLPGGSSLSATQIISQLNSLGYRPATLSEIYGLKSTYPSAVNTYTVALGTNLGGTYGYPTGFGSGSAGLGHNAGPFNTTEWSFVAVHN
ncbi:MAG: hypothetical protein KGJ35_01055 [Patescibacteria group bacterium]|nr:hypothetical protein [Patescibacteria group bacterium]